MSEFEFSLDDANFVLNLTRSPTAQTPRPGVARCRTFIKHRKACLCVKTFLPQAFVMLTMCGARSKTLRIFALKRAPTKRQLLQSLLAALRSENYCSIRATRQPFVVHLLPVHRARTKLAAAVKDFGIVVLCMVAKKVRKTLACCKTFLSRVVILRIV